jgi:hypothetical protein
MRFSVEVPDDLIADAAAAWARINDRRPAEQREPGTFDDGWARDALINQLGAILTADTHELENEATAAAVKDVQLRIGAVKRGAEPVDRPGPGGVV